MMSKPITAYPTDCTFDWQVFHKQLDIALAHMIEEQNILPNKTSLMELVRYSYAKTQLQSPQKGTAE